MLSEVGFQVLVLARLWCENQAALHIVSNSVLTNELNILRLIVILFVRDATSFDHCRIREKQRTINRSLY